LGSNITVQYSVGPIISLHGRITAREYLNRLGNQVQFSKTTIPPFTVGTVQSWFEEHERELQPLPWPAQSPDSTTLICFGGLREEQIPTPNISKET
jgi:hypothetical protein